MACRQGQPIFRIFSFTVPTKINHSLAASALCAAEKPPAEIRLELPPSLGPKMPTSILDPMRVKNEACSLAPVADVRLQEISALRRRAADPHIGDDFHRGNNSVFCYLCRA